MTVPLFEVARASRSSAASRFVMDFQMNTNMPTSMEEEFRLLQHELFNIIERWSTFCDLYGKVEDVEMLNSVAPRFFRIVQDVLVDDVILSIRRLLDRERIMGHDILSLEHLIKHLSPTRHSSLHAEVLTLYEKIQRDSKQLKKIRDSILAHNNLKKKKSQSVNLYTNVSRKVIDGQIESLCSLMNKIHGALNDTETDYASAGNLPDGALMLLEQLRGMEKKKCAV